MYEIAVHAFPFMLIYYHDKYKIQMCEKVVDDCLWRLKCAPDLFVTPKMLKILTEPHSLILSQTLMI